ncbi:35e64df5-874b-46de-bc58-438c11884562 [Thermothielavioides terrestris]|uniref:35e64df5-874b-46de-bc58-438c11884562 n=1 Tax=Thermothielavioides terrestris TaxID=2587410 RepID=A0A446BFY5_9PEZI|nr:35e64df5-874b-46de-bc58-438c11884562 [Thermothielavioides terrestris]
MHLRTPSALLSLLALALTTSASPVAVPRAEAADTQGCTDTSFRGFAWLARSFDFHASYVFTTPAHQNSWGFVSFDLYNPADKSTAHCEASSDQLSDFFYGNMPYKCNDTGRIGATSFDFSRPANRLRVNQTWTCDDRDPQWPTTFTGRGTANLSLDCTDTTWKNPNWTMGQIYSSRTIKCKPVDARILPVDLSAVA